MYFSAIGNGKEMYMWILLLIPWSRYSEVVFYDVTDAVGVCLRPSALFCQLVALVFEVQCLSQYHRKCKTCWRPQPLSVDSHSVSSTPRRARLCGNSRRAWACLSLGVGWKSSNDDVMRRPCLRGCIAWARDRVRTAGQLPKLSSANIATPHAKHEQPSRGVVGIERKKLKWLWLWCIGWIAQLL